ncbi:hypothetical protein JOC62_001873 [Clostridium sardiniense]|nr:hypothetical protein [Clostridium sardiniense]
MISTSKEEKYKNDKKKKAIFHKFSGSVWFVLEDT